MRYFLLLIIFFNILEKSFSQSSPKRDTTRIYQVGYKNIITIDSNRIYKQTADKTNKLRFRPVEIDYWYPAEETKSNPPIGYGYFLDLLQQRSNRFHYDTVYTSTSKELTAYLCANLKISDSSKLTQKPTSSWLNAIPVPQNFPLIIYFCSYNGMSYENITLFEWLTAHGYAVACITSVGRYPGNMSMKLPDLMEQVKDGEFAKSYLKTQQHFDTTEIGLVGYSWGGLAAVIMAMNNKDVKCLVSLDGSEMHYYGDSKEEDSDFDRISSSPEFWLRNFSVANAYLESGFKQAEWNADSIYNHFAKPGSQHLYVHFPKARHEDFSMLTSLGSDGYAANLYNTFNQFVLYYFDSHLKNKTNGLASLLDSIYRTGTGDSLYPQIKNKKDLILIKGRTVDNKRQENLAFVNIGIKNKNTGTVSASDGTFQVGIYPELKKDSLIFSMAGYQTKVISISELLDSATTTVSLNEKVVELKEVSISAKGLKTAIRGNTTTSNFVSVGLPLKFLGSETGIRLHLGKKPVLFKSFSFNISYNRLDTAVFRLNIYSMRSGVPFENILHQNILIPVGKQSGKYTLDLKDYKLVLDGDVLISLEWIQGSSSGRGNGAIFLSAGFLNSATWHRLTSQAEWKKATGLGVGFNVLVQQTKD